MNGPFVNFAVTHALKSCAAVATFEVAPLNRGVGRLLGFKAGKVGGLLVILALSV